jgi:hypothetical protein
MYDVYTRDNILIQIRPYFSNKRAKCTIMLVVIVTNTFSNARLLQRVPDGGGLFEAQKSRPVLSRFVSSRPVLRPDFGT